METFSTLVTGPLWRESTGHRWIPLTKAVTQSFHFSSICAITSVWVNSWDAGALRRHRAHYDVTVMYSVSNRTLHIPSSWKFRGMLALSLSQNFTLLVLACSQVFTASYASLSRQNEVHRVAKFSLRLILNIFTNCSAWCMAMAYYVNGKAVWIQRSDWDTTRFLKMQLTHLPWPKWPPFHRRYFQMHFREWKDFSIWLKFHFSLFLRAQFTLSQH